MQKEREEEEEIGSDIGSKGEGMEAINASAFASSSSSSSPPPPPPPLLYLRQSDNIDYSHPFEEGTEFTCDLTSLYFSDHILGDEEIRIIESGLRERKLVTSSRR